MKKINRLEKLAYEMRLLETHRDFLKSVEASPKHIDAATADYYKTWRKYADLIEQLHMLQWMPAQERLTNQIVNSEIRTQISEAKK